MTVIWHCYMVLPKKPGKFDIAIGEFVHLTLSQIRSRHQAHGRTRIFFHHLELDLQSVWPSSESWSTDVDDAIQGRLSMSLIDC